MNLRSGKLMVASLCLILLNTGLVLRIEARGNTVKIDKNDEKMTVECKGNTVKVSGTDNTITITGECSKLIVTGKDNNITASLVKDVVVSGTDNNVMLGSVAKIDAKGNDLNILWGNGIGGKSPRISQKKGKDINIVHTGK